MKDEGKTWLLVGTRSQEEEELADLELEEIGASFEVTSIISKICQLDDR